MLFVFNYRLPNKKENELIEACRREDVHTGFRYGDLQARVDLEDLGVDRTIILKWIFKK